MKKLLLAFVLVSFISCTDNSRVKSFGGTETVKIAPNEKFINITWKEANLWIIVQDTVSGKYYAREKSSLGLMEGTIIIEK